MGPIATLSFIALVSAEKSRQLHPIANMPSKPGQCHYYSGLQSSAREGLKVGIAEAARSRLRLYKAQVVDLTNPDQGRWHSEDRRTKSAGPRRKYRRPTTRSEDPRHRIPLQGQTVGSGGPHRRAFLFPRALLVEQTRGNGDRDGMGEGRGVLSAAVGLIDWLGLSPPA